MKKIFFIIFVLIFFLVDNECTPAAEEKEYVGSFLANDSGESHGGFEWAGEYRAALFIRGRKGSLSLSFLSGLGDPLTQHVYPVADFLEEQGSISFSIKGQRAVLLLVERDEIWGGKYDNSFAANNSDNPSEQIGFLPVDVFRGFRYHYYVELRLKNCTRRTLRLLNTPFRF
ncbi:MAG: hypothetical protein ACE5L7_04555 [Candidatus Aminicenantales bacterium]